MLLRELPPTAGLPLEFSDFLHAFCNCISGPKNRFEKALGEYLGVEELDLYSSGTLCLSIAFQAARELTGRTRIVVPAYTCPLVAIACQLAGCEIVLCDTENDELAMDPECLERLCDKTVAAVVPTDMAGLPVDIAFARKITSENGALLIEDAAQALGAKVNSKTVGSEADISIYSLAAGKGLSLYDGGIIYCREKSVREKVRVIASQRIARLPHLNILRIMQCFGLALFYNPLGLYFVYGAELRRHVKEGELENAVGDVFDFEIPSYEFDGFRKGVGTAALKRLPAFVEENRKRGRARAGLIRQRFPFLKVFGEPDSAEGSWPFLMLLAESEKQRDLIMNKLWTSGLGLTRLFIHDLAAYKYLHNRIPELARASCPNAASLAARSFTISNSRMLSEQDFAAVLELIDEALR